MPFLDLAFLVLHYGFFSFSLTLLFWNVSCSISSISGENKHYDTPTNPTAPARVPGGSSSGAAVAVAANLVDFSLGNVLTLNMLSIVLPSTSH